MHTFGKSISSDELIDAADRSGYKLLELLRARAKSANTKDKALVAAQYARIIRDGVRASKSPSRCLPARPR